MSDKYSFWYKDQESYAMKTLFITQRNTNKSISKMNIINRLSFEISLEGGE